MEAISGRRVAGIPPEIGRHAEGPLLYALKKPLRPKKFRGQYGEPGRYHYEGRPGKHYKGYAEKQHGESDCYYYYSFCLFKGVYEDATEHRRFSLAGRTTARGYALRRLTRRGKKEKIRAYLGS